MPVKLYRCGGQWVKIKGHPCWRVEKALMDLGIEYERVPGERTVVAEGTGQSKYPAIRFENGNWYREESKDMELTIREGRLLEKASSGNSAQGGPTDA